MKTIVIAGARSGIGKTTVAKEVAALLPGAVRVKIGHGPFDPNKGDIFYYTGTPWAQIVAAHPQALYLVLESNGVLAEMTPDCLIYLTADQPKPSAQAAHQAADLVRGEPTSSAAIRRLAQKLEASDHTVRQMAWAAGARIEPATAIIMAGGKSRRMGSDKAFLELSGLPAVEHLHRLLRPYFDHFIVSTSDDKISRFTGLTTVVDRVSGQGPLMGIACALAASPTSLNFVLACDIPYVHMPLVLKLMSLAEKYDIVLPSFRKGLVEPLFAVYRQKVAQPAEQILQNNTRTILALFPVCNTHVLEIADSSWYFNLNTPADYQSYCEMMNL